MRLARARACFPNPVRGGLFIERAEHHPLLFVFRRRGVGFLARGPNESIEPRLGRSGEFRAGEKRKEKSIRGGCATAWWERRGRHGALEESASSRRRLLSTRS